MERLKRLRKELGDRILDEEVKQEETKSKGKVRGIRSVTNESTFKPPGPIPTTPTKARTSGGSTSGMSSGSKPQSLNNSALQPQAQFSSPGLSSRLDGMDISGDSGDSKK
jgi:hypothetical protein